MMLKLNMRQERIFSLLAKTSTPRMSREKHGLHFYVPCPICLKRHGSSELRKKHLSINVDALDEEGSTHKCYCPKCGTNFNLRSLLGGAAMASVPSLGKDGAEASYVSGPKGFFLAGTSNASEDTKLLVPPGLCKPLSSLPSDHPALHYLRTRQFEVGLLEKLYLAEWCEQGISYGDPNARFPICTSQRLILYGRMFGSVKAWQARVIDYTDHQTGTYWVFDFDGYWRAISSVEERAAGKAKRSVPKYLSTPGLTKSAILINLDSALQASLQQGFGRTVILCEGMLDAARIGPMAVPILGKSLSDEQSRILKATCDRVVLMLDPDAEENIKEIQKDLGRCLSVRSVLLKGYKDPGDAPSDYLWFEISQALHITK